MQAPPNTVLILAGVPCQLRWDKRALFRADEVGLFTKREPGLGLATGAKYVWAMMPDAAREKHPTPEDVAAIMPPLPEVWEAINNAIAAGRDVFEKNVLGSTSGPSPASS